MFFHWLLETLLVTNSTWDTYCTVGNLLWFGPKVCYIFMTSLVDLEAISFRFGEVIDYFSLLGGWILSKEDMVIASED